MERTRTSTSARLLGIAVLVLGWSLTASRAPVEDKPPTLVNPRAAIPLLFPTLFAQTIISGCTNGDVNSGNQVTVTLTRIGGRKTDGTLITFSNNPPAVNLFGAAGSVAGSFLSGVAPQSDWPGNYNRLDMTMSSQFTYQGATQCVTGGQTRYYYTNGSSTSSPCIAAVATPCTAVSSPSVSAALSRSDFAATTVNTGGGDFNLDLNYTITAAGSITLNIGFDPAIAVYTLGANNVVFPSVTATFASQP